MDVSRYYYRYADEYLGDRHRDDDALQPMEYFHEFFCHTDDSLDAVKEAFYGHTYGKGQDSAFYPWADWFYIDGYGHPVAVEGVDFEKYYDAVIDADDFTAWLKENDCLDEGDR